MYISQLIRFARVRHVEDINARNKCLKLLNFSNGVIGIISSEKLFHASGSGVRLYDGPDLKLYILVSWDRSSLVCCLVHRGSTDDLLLLQIVSCLVWQTRDLHLSRNMLYLLSPRPCFFTVLKRDLFVYRDNSLTS